MKFQFITLLFLLFQTPVYTQQKIIDSLKNQLRSGKPDTNRVLFLGAMVRALYVSRPDTALVLAQEAYQLSQQLNYSRGEALSLNRIAMCYSAVGDYPKALQFLAKSYILYQRINDKEGILRSTNNIGDTYMTQGDYPKALEYFLEAKKAIDTVNATYVSAVVFLNIGQSYLNLKKADTAMTYLRQYYLFAKRNGFEDLYGDFERLLGDIAVINNQKTEALEYFNKSIRSAEHMDDKQVQSTTYESISMLYHKNNVPDSAIFYAQKSMNAAELGSYAMGVFKASKLLSQFYEGRDNSEAFRYYKISTQAKDSLFSQEKIKQVLAFAFEEKQRQQDIERAKKEYYNQIKLYILGGVLIMILTFTIILFRNNKEKQKTLTELRATQMQLIQAEKMASLGQLTAGIAHEIQNPLNFVNNFAEVNKELIDEIQEERRKERGVRDEHAEGEILNAVRQNLEKINFHGKRADGIVKSMLQHSRMMDPNRKNKKEPTDINALADEYLRLAYHGLRAKDNSLSAGQAGFNAALHTDLDESIGMVEVMGQDISRALLNLITNALQAVEEQKKRKQDQGESYTPEVSVMTKKSPLGIEIRIRDNGPGIPENLLDKIFQPFFTTRPAGQGTGLGLSLVFDIVKAHGGEIKVETKEGEGTSFIILLPLYS